MKLNSILNNVLENRYIKNIISFFLKLSLFGNNSKCVEQNKETSEERVLLESSLHQNETENDKH